MPYVGIPTATWSDSNANGQVETNEVNEEGWESQADSFYKELMRSKENLLHSGLFGFAVMSLFDNPRNDYGGYPPFLDVPLEFGI